MDIEDIRQAFDYDRQDVKFLEQQLKPSVSIAGLVISSDIFKLILAPLFAFSLVFGIVLSSKNHDLLRETTSTSEEVFFWCGILVTASLLTAILLLFVSYEGRIFAYVAQENEKYMRKLRKQLDMESSSRRYAKRGTEFYKFSQWANNLYIKAGKTTFFIEPIYFAFSEYNTSSNFDSYIIIKAYLEALENAQTTLFAAFNNVGDDVSCELARNELHSLIEQITKAELTKLSQHHISSESIAKMESDALAQQIKRESENLKKKFDNSWEYITL